VVCKQEPPGAKPPVTGLVKVVVGYNNNTTPQAKAANVMHIQWQDKVNHPLVDLGTLLTHWQTLWPNAVQTTMHPSWSMTSITATSLGGDGLTTSIATAAPGSASGTALPPQCAMCFSWKSGIVARGGRGRTYLPGLTSAGLINAAGSEFLATYCSAVKGQLETFLSTLDALTIGGASPILVIPSYYHNCQLRTPPLITQVNDVVVHNRLDSQRKRSGKESIFPVS
jgi:hypothetical protein